MNRRRLIHEEYQRQKRLPFVWGQSDCLRTACAFAVLLTGRDPGSFLIGAYDGERSAQRVMVEHGWRDIGDVAASIFAELPVAQARDGDWAHIVQNDAQGSRDGLGVVVGEHLIVRSPEGLGLVPLTAANRAFRVE